MISAGTLLPVLAFLSLGPGELLFIFLVLLLLFGARRIPDIARALGRASHEFKKAKDEIASETDALVKESEKAAAKADAAEADDKNAGRQG